MSTQAVRNRVRAERGAILIHVAIAAMVLIGFSAFVLDYGVIWLSRGQAQNAADAGALAGAVARAFDEAADPPSAGGRAFTSALRTAQANLVWNEAPVVNVTWPCPAFVPGGGTTCVTVDVFRDRLNGNPLPTLLAPLLGVTTQQVRATATARAVPANATDCLRPLAIPDRWREIQTPPWDPNDTFDAWQNVGGIAVPIASPDYYREPTFTDVGTGFTLSTDYGEQITLKGLGFGPNFQAGWYQPVVVSNSAGPELFADSLAACNGVAVGIDQFLPIDLAATVPADATTGIATLIAQDPGAAWDSGTASVTGSCAPGCGAFSPRILALPLFDPSEFQRGTVSNDWSACPTGGPCVHVRNIVGFFVSQLSGNDVVGYLMRYPGVLTSSGTGVGADSAFTVAVTLVR